MSLRLWRTLEGAGWIAQGARPILQRASAACLLLVTGASALAQQGTRPGQLPTLPLTQLDERALAADLDNRAFNLTFAQPVPVRDLLLLLVRGTNLSIVPDPSLTGSFTGELKNVTVRQALGLILPSMGLDYSIDGSFVRVFRREPETRIFDINYVASSRVGTAGVGGPSAGGSLARVDTTISTDVFSDIAKGVKTLLSERATFNVDRQAGLLQVADFPERLERVAAYLDAVHDRVHRQVQIEARVLEVELADPAAQSLDWTALAEQPGEAAAARPMLSGLRAADVPRFMAALAAQGTVTQLASPKLLAMNNEPAVVRAGSGDQAFTLGVTPQITAEGVITLSLSPIISARTSDEKDKNATPPAIGEADTVARIADGETIVTAGFTRERVTRERKAAGIKGGWFGRATVVTRKRVELVILLTPHIVSVAGSE